MNSELLHSVVARQQTAFRAHFTALDDQDFAAILHGPCETLLAILRQRYGYGQADARAAWNEFVLCYVDGSGTRRLKPQLALRSRPAPTRRYGLRRQAS